MNDVVNNLQALILSNPTLALRQVLQQPNIIAIAGGRSIEVWPCLELLDATFNFRSMNSSCYLHTPITYRWMNNTKRGYLDAGTNIIRHAQPPEVDCTLVHRLPLTLRNKSFLYSPTTGRLSHTRKPLFLRPIRLNQSSWEIPNVIFHPVVMYHLEEFSQHVLNEILGGLTKQQEILNLLGMQVDRRSPRETASQTAANIVNQGMFGFLWGITIDIKQVWVFLSCCYVTATILIKLCWQYGCLKRVVKRIQKSVKQKLSRAQDLYRYVATPATTGIITTLDAQSKLNSRSTMVEMTKLSAGNRPTAEYQPFRINCNKGPYADIVGSKLGVEVNGVRMAGLLDTGAQLSLMPRCSVERILAFNGSNTQLTDKVTKAVSASGHILVLSGTIKAKVQVGSLALRGEFAIADEMPYELLLGRDFLKELGPITVDLQRSAVKVGSETLPLIAANTKIEGRYPKVNYIRVTETADAPHNAECILEGSCCLQPDAVYLVESLDRQTGRKVAKSLVKAKDNSVPLRLLNPGNSDVKIHKNARIAIATELGPEEEERVDRQLKIPCIVSPGKTAKTIPNLAELGTKFKDLGEDGPERGRISKTTSVACRVQRYFRRRRPRPRSVKRRTARNQHR